MTDAAISKQALLQAILLLIDAVSLPWQAVKTAWATSMHEIEDGSLYWADATQLNPISALQIAMAKCEYSII